MICRSEPAAVSPSAGGSLSTPDRRGVYVDHRIQVQCPTRSNHFFYLLVLWALNAGAVLESWVRALWLDQDQTASHKYYQAQEGIRFAMKGIRFAMK